MSEPVLSTKLTGANFSRHRIASVAPSTFAQVFGITSPTAPRAPIAELGQYFPLQRDTFTRSNNNVRFSGQSVQAQFAEFARAARVARFSGLGVTKNIVSDGNHTLLYQFASAQAKPNEANPAMAALRVTQPAFGDGPIHVDVVNYRHAPNLNQKLTLHNSVSSALPRLDHGASVPVAPNLVRFGNGSVVPAAATSVAMVQPNQAVSDLVNVLKKWWNALPPSATQWLKTLNGAFPLPLGLKNVSLPVALTGGPVAVCFGSTKPERVDLVTAMRFGNNVVEILSHKGSAATTAQTFASLKKASAGISQMANQLEQERGFSRIAEKTVSHFAAANKFSGANPYAKSPFASNPFASVAFAGGSKPSLIQRPTEAITTA